MASSKSKKRTFDDMMKSHPNSSKAKEPTINEANQDERSSKVRRLNDGTTVKVDSKEKKPTESNDLVAVDQEQAASIEEAKQMLKADEEPITTQTVDAIVEPVTESVVEPAMETQMLPVMETIVKAVTEPVVSEPATEPIMEPTAGPIMQPTSEAPKPEAPVAEA